jgi:hypothetical protein
MSGAAEPRRKLAIRARECVEQRAGHLVECLTADSIARGDLEPPRVVRAERDHGVAQRETEDVADDAYRVHRGHALRV